MNKQLFKPPFGVWCETEDEYKALRAVIEADGWPVSNNHEGFRWKDYYGLSGECEFRMVFSSLPQLSLQDALFRGAPDWAVDVRKYGDVIAFTDGIECIVDISGVITNWGWGSSSIIATRDKKQPQWPEAGSLPPVGSEVEVSPPIHNHGDRVKVLCHDDGNAICRYLNGDSLGSVAEFIASELKQILSERDKFIELALSKDCVPQDGMLSRRDFCGELYDAGARFVEKPE